MQCMFLVIANLQPFLVQSCRRFWWPAKLRGSIENFMHTYTRRSCTSITIHILVVSILLGYIVLVTDYFRMLLWVELKMNVWNRQLF